MIHRTHTSQRAEPVENGPSKEFMKKVRNGRKKHRSVVDKLIKKIAKKKRRNFLKNLDSSM